MDAGHLAVAGAIGDLEAREGARIIHAREAPGLVSAVLVARAAYFLIVARYDANSLRLEIERFTRSFRR